MNTEKKITLWNQYNSQINTIESRLTISATLVSIAFTILSSALGDANVIYSIPALSVVFLYYMAYQQRIVEILRGYLLFIEEELFVRGEGYCFGEWALIYNQPRSASIYTLEDSIFFTLGEKPFKDSFLESINNYEFEKKKFALENFFPFQMIKERQLSMYKNIVPINCEKNQIIFKEGDISDSIYLIYFGSYN